MILDCPLCFMKHLDVTITDIYQISILSDIYIIIYLYNQISISLNIKIFSNSDDRGVTIYMIVS